MKRRRAKKQIPYDSLYCYGLDRNGMNPVYCPHYSHNYTHWGKCSYLKTDLIIDMCKECNAHLDVPKKVKKKYAEKNELNYAEIKSDYGW